MSKSYLHKLAMFAALMFAGRPLPATAVDAPADPFASTQPFLSANLAPKILNHSFVPNWIGASDRFWYDLRTTAGHEVRIVDAATGAQRPAFDHRAMASVLGKQLGKPLQAEALPIFVLSIQPDEKAILLAANGKSYRCDLPVTQCAALPDTPPQTELSSAAPDGRRTVFLRDHNLWLRDADGGHERQLTSDGIQDFSYGDLDPYMDFLKVVRSRFHVPRAFNNVVWSPDGRYILALRQDMRPFSVKQLLTEYLPPEGGYDVSYAARAATPADPERPASHLVLIDTASGRSVASDIDPQAFNDYALPYFMGARLWWTPAAVYLITASRGGHDYQLTRIDLATGHAAPVIRESAPHFISLNTYDYSNPNVYVTASGKEAIWFSERDGWGHLYLYDAATGRMKRRITEGDWVVADVLRVDEATRTLYFTAVGREGGNPYFRRLYKVGMDGGQPKLLTPENADHDFKNVDGYFSQLNAPPGSSLSPSGKYFVDNFSTTQAPPISVVRDNSGRLIGKVMEADASAFHAMGLTSPEDVVVKAADGQTDLWGVVFKPLNFDPSKRYPVIDITYPGPQGRWSPLTFRDDILSASFNAYALNQLGFVVVSIDGRGTAYRSRKFRDAFLGTPDALGAADQVAAVRNMAATRPYMDTGRVGVVGGSFGGYAALADMLLYPDFFKVGVSIAGPQDFRYLLQSVTAERFFGVPTGSKAASDYYDQISNVRNVGKLRGKLFLVYGMLDENVPFKHAAEIFDALIKADKPFDSLVVPDVSHAISSEPYVVRRMMAYFTDNLGGPEPRAVKP